MYIKVKFSLAPLGPIPPHPSLPLVGVDVVHLLLEAAPLGPIHSLLVLHHPEQMMLFQIFLSHIKNSELENPKNSKYSREEYRKGSLKSNNANPLQKRTWSRLMICMGDIFRFAIKTIS